MEKTRSSSFHNLGVLIKTFWLLLRSTLSGHIHFNGSYRFMTLGDIFEKYEVLHLPTVTEATRVKQIARVKRSLAAFFGTPIALLTPERLTEILKTMKATYVPGHHAKRYNFQKELKDLKAMLTWWSDHYDFRFTNPVRPFHASLAVMEEIPEKDRKISMEETLLFFSSLEKGSLYHDLAVVQFYCGGRIGEIAGIQVKNIDLQNRVLKIKEIICWINGSPRIKHRPKNGKARNVFINDTLLEVFARRLKQVPSGCVFLFHDCAKPLRYNRINVAFNEGWKRAGLNGKFSGSHLLRYSSAQAARKITGSLDAAASVTGHKSMRMAEHYGKLDSVAINQSSVIEMEKHILNLQLPKVS